MTKYKKLLHEEYVLPLKEFDLTAAERACMPACVSTTTDVNHVATAILRKLAPPYLTFRFNQMVTVHRKVI